MSNAREIAQLGSVPSGRKNLIINGAMVIDQRNSGSSVALSSSVVYDTDRFLTRLGTSSSSTAQQVSDAPDGFNKSLKLTIGTGASPSAATGDGYFGQIVEGYNSAHLNWGTSSAKTVTFSFWVKSSLTGSFGLVVANYALNMCYPTSYTINSANTWEHKTITISGPTSGGFDTASGGSIYILFDWGCGSDFKGTANSWSVSDYRGGATGTQSICATSGATWQITGVQLEVGSVATEFEHRSYGEELALCQRYYIKNNRWNIWSGYTVNASNYFENAEFPTTMRTAPTVLTTYIGSAGFAVANPTVQQQDIHGFYAYMTCNLTGGSGYFIFRYTADAEL